MKISTRGRYSTRLMMELASRHKQGPIFLKDISKAQDISLKYLSQLIIPLKIAGLVKSTRGAHGGYTLARDPEDITLREIVEAVEGPIAMVECINDPELCNRYRECASKEIWAEITQQIYLKLDSINLKQMLARQEKLEKKSNS